MTREAVRRGELLKELRKRTGKTQEQILETLEKAGRYMSQAQLSKFERGQIEQPTINQINDLAFAFDMSLGDMLDYLELTSSTKREEVDKKDILITHFLKAYPDARTIIERFRKRTKNVPHTLKELEETLDIAAAVLQGRKLIEQEQEQEQPANREQAQFPNDDTPKALSKG